MIRLAFFDVDGTLSAPVYRDGDKETIGFTDEAWLAYCEEHGDDAYRYCKRVPCAYEYAKKLRDEGATLYVLSATACEKESGAKIKFVHTKYEGLFSDFYFVAHDAEKIDVIRRVAKEHDCALSDCVLVEDTYATLLKAHEIGVRAVHVSNLMADAT